MKTAAFLLACCATTVLANGMACAQGAQSYPFEGIWAETATADACRIAGYVYNRAYVRSTSDDDDSCKVNKVESQPDGTFILKLNCNDASGDGPTKRFNTQQSLKLDSANSMVVTYSNGSGPVTYKRCAANTPVAGPPIRPTPAPPQPQPAPQEGQAGLLCKLTINGQRQDWQISIDLKRSLYTARVNNAVVRQRQAAILDVVLGNSLTPQPGQLRLQVNLGINMYMAIKPNNQAFLQPLSGSNPTPVGSCTDMAFQGL